MRSSGAERMVSLRSRRRQFDIEYRSSIDVSSARSRPPQPATVELHHRGGTLSTETDELGRFDFDGLNPGPVSVVIRTHGDNPEVVKTEWDRCSRRSHAYLKTVHRLSIQWRRPDLERHRRRRTLMSDFNTTRRQAHGRWRVLASLPIDLLDRPVGRSSGPVPRARPKQGHRGRRCGHLEPLHTSPCDYRRGAPRNGPAEGGAVSNAQAFDQGFWVGFAAINHGCSPAWC